MKFQPCSIPIMLNLQVFAGHQVILFRTFLFFLFQWSIFIFIWKADRQKERNRAVICWFSSQMSAIARAEPSQHQGPRILSHFLPQTLAGHNVLWGTIRDLAGYALSESWIRSGVGRNRTRHFNKGCGHPKPQFKHCVKHLPCGAFFKIEIKGLVRILQKYGSPGLLVYEVCGKSDSGMVFMMQQFDKHKQRAKTPNQPVLSH